MTIERVAILFDDRIRPETTGIYCRRALDELCREVIHLRPDDMQESDMGSFDLLIRVDDGLDYPWPAAARLTAFWAIDTHIHFARTQTLAAQAELVFAAQRDGAEQLHAAGMATAEWLPLACDPAVHRKYDVPKAFDVSFVGNIFPGPRKELIDRIQEYFPHCFVGQAYFEEMARIYSASRVVFNRSVENDVNMRVFEALASGSMLLTNDLSNHGLAELFQNEVHLATYRDGAELIDRLDWYLEHDDAREEIAARGFAEVTTKHTYRHRMERILERAAAVSPKPRQTSSSTAPAAPDATQETALSAVTISEPVRANGKSRSYFEHVRPEILELVPRDSQRVLDVGCGTGALGVSLKARQPVKVWGIEREAGIAEIARGKLDRVICSDAQDATFDVASFDCIVCGDVLEHLRHPDQFLKKACGWLGPGGCLIASIPNVRHHSIVRSLLAGNWTYESAGLLDDDHVRFFTRREIEKLFYRAGFQLEEQRVVPGPGYEEWLAAGGPGEVRAGGLQLRGLRADEAEEFFIYQYLLRATPKTRRSEWPLTSIVIVTHNALAYTRMCVDSIRQFTDEPYELIFVDNASTDGTVEYVQSLDDRLIVNSENRGFPAAVNQALQMATGEYLLLLNNDVVVTTGWLRRMLDAFQVNTDIGLVGPCSNCVSGAQQVTASYEDLSELDGFAWDWGQSHQSQISESDRLVGFCLLIKREVIERVGSLDERFGLGNFEDDDYCRRARELGYRCVIAWDAFIHHFGSRSFRAAEIDLSELLRENERRYRDKWNIQDDVTPGAISVTEDMEPSVNTISAESPKREPPGKPKTRLELAKNVCNGLQLEPQSTVRLSLCMIVRDNESTLEPCLASIRPWVDEIIVVDTGSHDRTPEIARQFGARLYHFEWCDDFAAARNESLKYARGEWIFWMDSDDTISEECGRKLRDLCDGKHEDQVLGYVMQVHCPGPADPNTGHSDVTAVDHIKLFRNRSELRFECRIHEQILPAIRRAGGDVRFTEIFVDHSGSDNSTEARAKKYERDFRLLRLELEDKPDHPFALFNLGMTHADARQYDEAVSVLRRCLEVSSPAESHVRKAYALLASSYQQLARHLEAWDTCRMGLRSCPDDPELLFRTGMLHHHFGRLDQAAETYIALLEYQGPRHFASVDCGLTTYKARHNLALVYEDMEQWAAAECQWREILAISEHYRAGFRGLGRTLLKQGKRREVQQLIDEWNARNANHPEFLRAEGLLLQSRLAKSQGDIARARGVLEQARLCYPDDLDILREWCEFAFSTGAPSEAATALSELAEGDCEDGSAPHNLGSILLQLDDPQRALQAYRESLRRRPNSSATWTKVGHALNAVGSFGEALDAWERALRLDPENAEARAALDAVSAAAN